MTLELRGVPRTFRINCSLTNYTPVSSFTQPYNIYSIYSIYHVYNMLQLASWLPRRPLGTKSLWTNLSLIQNTDQSPPAKTIAGGDLSIFHMLYLSYFFSLISTFCSISQAPLDIREILLQIRLPWFITNIYTYCTKYFVTWVSLYKYFKKRKNQKLSIF